jgi:type IV pilus assembly protein PilC
LEAIMSRYSYEAVDASGLGVRGVLEVASQSQALRRIKEMGFFPTRVRLRRRPPLHRPGRDPSPLVALPPRVRDGLRLSARVKPRVQAVFTRQLATLIEAGMPLLQGLRLLREQAADRRLKRVLGDVCRAIDEGESLSTALGCHPGVFSPLYVNLVRAGEASGALDLVLLRLAQFQEKSQRTKGRILAAMFYPMAVMVVAIAILAALMVFVVPRFEEVFDGLLGGVPLPAFTVMVFNLSDFARNHLPLMVLVLLLASGAVAVASRTGPGRGVLDVLKLRTPLLGEVFRKVAVARLARTLGTLLGSGVPVLQALSIARETAGNAVVARVVAELHLHVKQGDPVAPTLRASRVFPAIVAGMVDVGEQTGALPEMLSKIADIYDDEVDNAIAAMTSLLEPVMIVLLAVIVGSIVIALFLPIITVGNSI